MSFIYVNFCGNFVQAIGWKIFDQPSLIIKRNENHVNSNLIIKPKLISKYKYLLMGFTEEWIMNGWVKKKSI